MQLKIKYYIVKMHTSFEESLCLFLYIFVDRYHFRVRVT